MENNLNERLAPAIEALRIGHWQDYADRIRECLLEFDDDEVLTALGARHGLDVDLVDVLLSCPQGTSQAVGYRLLQAIGKAAALTSAQARGLINFADRPEVSFRLMSADGLKAQITRTPSLSLDLGDWIRAGTTHGEGAIRAWSAAFCAAAPRDAAGYALDLATGRQRDTQMLVVLMTYLPLHHDEVRSLVAEREADLAQCVQMALPEIGPDAWAAMMCLAEVSPTAMAYIDTAVETAEPAAVIALANWLHRVTTPTVGPTAIPLDNFVRRLLVIAATRSELRAPIDSAVESLLRRSALRPIVLSCVSELGVMEARVAEVFEETFSTLCEKPDEFAFMLTTWLVSPTANFVSIDSMLTRCTSGRAPPRLDDAVFSSTTPERRVKAARRMLALISHGPTLCQFISAVAEMTLLGSERLELSSQMFNEAFIEYPGATEDFLKNKTRASSRKDPAAPVYRGVYAAALRWRRVLDQLPRCKELRPTDGELQTLRALRERVNRDILRGATERSVFASIFTSVHLAQGRRFASHTKTEAPRVAEMHQASHFVELPSSERADPMRGMLARRRLLMGAR